MTKKNRSLTSTGSNVVQLLDFVISAEEETAEDRRVLKKEKLVVFVDICSSSSIVDNLMLNGKEQLYRELLETLKRFLQKSELCEMYKFIGDGWVLLFPTDVQQASRVVAFLTELSQLCRGHLAKLEQQLSQVPKVMGLTFGIDHGPVFRLVMNRRVEYIGRALNIASRLQGKVKDIDDTPGYEAGYKALMSRRTFNLIQPSCPSIRVSTRLRNIYEEDFECFLLTILGS